MYSDLLSARLREIVKLAIRERWDISKLKAALRDEIQFVYRKQTIQDALIKEFSADYNFLKNHTLNDKDYDKLNGLFSNAYAQFAKQKAGLNEKLATIVKAGFAQDLDESKIIARAEAVFHGREYYAKTVVNTTGAAISSLKTFVDAKDAGIERFRYEGSPPQRKFCKRLYNKVYTVKQIEELSREVGYDVMLYRGLWNCRHMWNPYFEK